MKKWFSLKKIGIALLVVFALMQLVRIDKTNPKARSENDFLVFTEAPQNIVSLVKSACYDCHSNETKYPWYSNIAPVSWWLKNHINEGREELNFSNWESFSPKRKQRKLDECLEMINEEEMPLPSYTWIHKDARLTASQRTELAKWLQSIGARSEAHDSD